MDLSVVVPVYREEKNIDAFLARVVPILEKITQDYEIIFAMDPSPDRTEELIVAQHGRNPRVKLVKFSRRIGQPMATLGGLHYSAGAAVVVMDVDLQDPPELISEMHAKFREGYDVVYAQRRSRQGETLFKRATAYLGYRLINRISEVEIPPNTGDFRMMSRRVVDEVNRLKESHGFLRGMVALVGFRQTAILFDRPARHAGAGNYNRYLGSLRIAFNGIFCFSTNALKLSTFMGFVIAGFSFLLMAVYLFYKIMGWEIKWGNPTMVILIAFLGGVQLISVGILGEYIGRIYEEVRERPKFIVDTTMGVSVDRDEK